MKSISFALSVAASAALMVLAPAASAADGLICYSSTFSYNIGGGSTSVTYPQVTNATTFYCTSAMSSLTVSQLSQLGWIVVSLTDVPYSQTADPNTGSQTSRLRYRLVIQK
jgi:hypothetical protein